MTKSSPKATEELGVDIVFDAREPSEFISFVRDQGRVHSTITPTPNHSRTRAFIKIQDGCDRFCSYCIVPYVRGKPTSRPLLDILNETATHAKSGVLEIVLTGIQVASYGEDIGTVSSLTEGIALQKYANVPVKREACLQSKHMVHVYSCEAGATELQATRPVHEVCERTHGYEAMVSKRKQCGSTNLSILLEQVLQTTNIPRVRLSSLEPHAITNEFLHVAATFPALCDHFHLSLQSGCDTTLAQMNRRYTTIDYAKIVAKIRDIRPAAAITTDIIVGFPGETDAHFTESLAFVQAMEFAQVHVFEYSKRDGTPAATMPGQVPDAIKTDRGKQMRTLAKKLTQNFYQIQVGKTMPVLFEQKKDGMWQGRTSNYCPVSVCSKIDLANTIQPVNITACTLQSLQGEAQNIQEEYL